MSEMDAHVHALSGAYAVDALDDLERLRFERHLGDCPECRTEVASLREAAALLSSTESVPPPPELRAAVLAGIKSIRPLPPETGALSAPPAPRHAASPAPRRRRRANLLLAAAAAVVAVGAGAVVFQNLTDDTSQGVAVADRVLQADDAEEQRLTFEGGAATLVRSETEGKAVVVTDEMPAPASGEVYQLWLADDDGVVSAGLVPNPGDPVVLDGDVMTADGAAITVEQEGGAAQPTSDPIASFDFADLESSA